MNKKNIKLLSILIFLILVTVLTASYEKTTSYDELDRFMFAVEDTTKVKSISISFRGESNVVTIKRNESNWILNNNFKVDKQRLRQLISVLYYNKVKNEVLIPENGELRQTIENNELKVDLEIANINHTFYVSHNATKTKSFWSKDQTTYFEVGVEAYNVFLSGLFSSNPLFYKNKYIIRGSAPILGTRLSTIQDVIWEVRRNKINQMVFDPNRMNKQLKKKVELGEYSEKEVLSTLYQLKISDFVKKGMVKQYDSLMNTSPKIILNVSYQGELGLHTKNDKILTDTFHFYDQLKGDQYVLVKNTTDEEYSRIHHEQIKNLTGLYN